MKGLIAGKPAPTVISVAHKYCIHREPLWELARDEGPEAIKISSVASLPLHRPAAVAIVG